MTETEITKAVEALKKNSLPVQYPPGHTTCCRGNRLGAEHSSYCFTLKGYYTMTLHPGIKIPSKVRRRLARRNK